jgi:hypothetical protein
MNKRHGEFNGMENHINSNLERVVKDANVYNRTHHLLNKRVFKYYTEEGRYGMFSYSRSNLNSIMMRFCNLTPRHQRKRVERSDAAIDNK